MQKRLTRMLWMGLISAVMFLVACDNQNGQETQVNVSENSVENTVDQMIVDNLNEIVASSQTTDTPLVSSVQVNDIFKYAADDAINFYLNMEMVLAQQPVKDFLAQPEAKETLDEISDKLKINVKDLSCHILLNVYDEDLATGVILFRNGEAAKIVNSLIALDDSGEIQQKELNGKKMLVLNDDSDEIQLILASANELHFRYKEDGLHRNLVSNEYNSLYRRVRGADQEDVLMSFNIGKRMVKKLLENEIDGEELPFDPSFFMNVKMSNSRVQFYAELDCEQSDYAALLQQEFAPQLVELKNNSSMFAVSMKSEIQSDNSVPDEIKRSVIPLCDELDGIIRTLKLSQRGSKLVASASVPEAAFTKGLNALIQLASVLDEDDF